MDILIRALKAHCKKNTEAIKIIGLYSKGYVTLKETLIALANTMER